MGIRGKEWAGGDRSGERKRDLVDRETDRQRHSEGYIK